MSLFKSSFEIITEMVRGEKAGTSNEDLTVELTNIDFGKMMDDMQSITAGELHFTTEMVTVRECKRLDCDLVEIDELAKYMSSNGIRNFKTAISNIAEAFGRDPMKFAVVIDEGAINMAVREANSYLTNPDEIIRQAKVNSVVDTKKVLDLMYNQGISLVKK